MTGDCIFYEHWLSLAPGLHIEDRSLFERIGYLEQAPGSAARIRDDGYLQGTADWGLDVALMADTVRALSAANLSPLFAFVYDEFWLPFFKLHLLHNALLGGSYCLLPDFWILNVDPKKGGAGWRPHRGKGRRALFDDGTPKSLTTWIPLSAATPLNGCLYVVPAQHDPTYATADENEMKFDHQSIRALPANPGDFVLWNQAVFHWGGKTSPLAARQHGVPAPAHRCTSFQRPADRAAADAAVPGARQADRPAAVTGWRFGFGRKSWRWK